MDVIREMATDDWAIQSMVFKQKEDSEIERFAILGIIGALVALASPGLVPAGRQYEAGGHGDGLTRLRRRLIHHFQKGDLAWTAASVFLETELHAQDMASAATAPLGTDEHLFEVYRICGGNVIG